jgi:predicted transcriptional regulator YdeE
MDDIYSILDLILQLYEKLIKKRIENEQIKRAHGYCLGVHYEEAVGAVLDHAIGYTVTALR